jgi:hypothetical protein
MLARAKAKQIWQGGIRLAAILAGAQVPVAFAKAASHSTAVASIKASVDCAGESVARAAVMLGQTLWGTVDACMVGQMVHAAGLLFEQDSAFNPAHAVVGIIGHELVGHLVSFVFQILSCR